MPPATCTPFATCIKLPVMINFLSRLKVQVKWLFVFCFAVLGAQSLVATAATPECPPITELAEKQIAGSLIAFNGEVMEVKPGPVPAPAIAPRETPGGFIQELTFQVRNSWKGSHQ